MSRSSPAGSPRTASHPLLVLALAASTACAALLTGCTSAAEPYVRSDELLGTAISVTVYAESEDAASAADAAFEAMAGASELDAYDEDSPVAQFNAVPFDWGSAGESAERMAAEVDALPPEISEAFDYRMWGVSALYDFGGEGRVPTDDELAGALRARDSFESTASSDAPDPLYRFAVDPEGAVPEPGLDFGGLAKGHALDLAAAALEDAVDGVAEGDAASAPAGAIVTAVSTTIAIGEKPGGESWRVGIEDPRQPGRVIAVAERAAGPLVVSTSGDYQQYVEVDGERYHHILDPATGRPARGMRSLTLVATDISATRADILSTALFVLGRERAQEYARENGFALYVVDDEAGTHVTPAPDASGITVEETAEPTP
jgi:thiamine biosynthesis lipoprotein